MHQLIAWYVFLQLMGIAAWPLLARATAPLRGLAWPLAKTFGLLLVTWLVWLVCMLAPVPFVRVTVAVAVAAVGVSGWVLWASGRLGSLRLPSFEEVWTWEGVFLVAFAFFAVLRAHEPAIQNFEKPMDMAFLDGLVTADRLPTQDTWLAGFGEPYYYLGYTAFAVLAKLVDVPPAVAYNLAAATIPALSIVGLAGLVWTLARCGGISAPWSAAGAAVGTLLALVMGNARAFLELLLARGVVTPGLGAALSIRSFGQGITPGVWPPSGLWWFASSRIVPNLQPEGINEFPFFTELLSDLHPHFMAIPFELMALACGVLHLVGREKTLRSRSAQALSALALGSLLVINTWDIAPFWLLYLGLAWLGGRALPVRDRILSCVVAPLVGVMLFVPYFVGYHGPPLGMALVKTRTPLGSELVIFGGQIALLAILGLWFRWSAGDRRGWLLAGGAVALGAALFVARQPTLGLLLALFLVLAPWPFPMERLGLPGAVAIGVGWFASAMLLGVEVVYLDDVFHSPMNTIFKFHENVWVILGVALGLGLAALGSRARRARWGMTAVAGLTLAVGLVYPVSAAWARLAEVPSYGLTLDGAAFLPPGDAGAVDWLRAHQAPGRSVLAEAVGNDYTDAGRMATFSGSAAVLGWAGHELQWRGPLAELTARTQDMAGLYRDAPIQQIPAILARYQVQYVVVGTLERQIYGPGVATRFQNLTLVYSANGTQIYAAPPASP